MRCQLSQEAILALQGHVIYNSLTVAYQFSWGEGE